jgi:hypothetical protein
MAALSLCPGLSRAAAMTVNRITGLTAVSGLVSNPVRPPGGPHPVGQSPVGQSARSHRPRHLPEFYRTVDFSVGTIRVTTIAERSRYSGIRGAISFFQ